MMALKVLCLSSRHQDCQARALSELSTSLPCFGNRASSHAKKPFTTLVVMANVSRSTDLRDSSQVPSTASAQASTACEVWNLSQLTTTTTAHRARPSATLGDSIYVYGMLHLQSIMEICWQQQTLGGADCV